MSELVCNYAVVRFLPYRETGEFVNVGLLVCFPQIDYIDFRLLEKRRRRVRQFFPELDEKIYRAAISAVKRELTTHRNAGPLLTHETVNDGKSCAALGAFVALTRRRESLLHFSEPRTKIVAEPPDVAMNRLYDYFVERVFAQQRVYQETVMQRRLRDWLKLWKLSKHYKANGRIGDKKFHITLPFVRYDDENPVSAIKPFDLNRADPTEVYKHGDPWVQGIQRLHAKKQLPDQTIFVVQWPTEPAPRAAADEIVAGLREAQARIVDFDAEQVREQIA